MDNYSSFKINNLILEKYPQLNNNQILLDWINTINEPNCLLVNNVEDVKNGQVFIELLSHYLLENKLNSLNFEFHNKIKFKKPFEIYPIIIEFLEKITDNHELIKKIKNNISIILKNEEIIFQLIDFFNKLFKGDIQNKINFYYNNNNDNSNKKSIKDHYSIKDDSTLPTTRSNYLSYRENLEEKFEKIEKNLFINIEKKQKYKFTDKIKNIMNKITIKKRKNPALLNQINLNNFKKNILKNQIYKKKIVNYSNSQENIYEMRNKKYEKLFETKDSYKKNNSNNNFNNFTFQSFHQELINKKTIDSNQNIINNNYKNKESNNKKENISNSNSNINMNNTKILNTNLSTQKSDIQITYGSPLSITALKTEKTINNKKRPQSLKQNKNNLTINKLYDESFTLNNNLKIKQLSKENKSFILMTRGISIYNKFNQISANNQTVYYNKFLKPTQPIIEISLNIFNKYNTILKNNKNFNELKNKNYSECNSNYYTTLNEESINNNSLASNNLYFNTMKNKKNFKLFEPFALKTNIKNSNKKTEVRYENNESDISLQTLNKNKINNSILNNNNNINNENLNKNNFPNSQKIKLSQWLINLGIIKNKNLSINEVPNLFSNGVLFCDLLNRLAGKNEIIKGIIRKTNSKTQNQININKVINYLKTIENFNHRHLWDGNEILNSNKPIIWEFLNDIFVYYNKNNFCIEHHSNSMKNLNNLNKSNNLNINNKITSKENNNNLNKKFNNFDSNNNNTNKINDLEKSLFKNKENFNSERNQINKIFKNRTNNNIKNDYKISKNRFNSQEKNNSFKQFFNNSLCNNYTNSKNDLIHKTLNDNNNTISGFLLFKKSSVKKLKNNLNKFSENIKVNKNLSNYKNNSFKSNYNNSNKIYKIIE